MVVKFVGGMQLNKYVGHESIEEYERSEPDNRIYRQEFIEFHLSTGCNRLRFCEQCHLFLVSNSKTE